MGCKDKQPKHSASKGGGKPWREKLSTKIISCIVTLSLALCMVPLPAFAEQTGTDAQAGTADSAAQTVVTEYTAQVPEAAETAEGTEADAATETEAATTDPATAATMAAAATAATATEAETNDAELNGAVTRSVMFIVKGAVVGAMAIVRHFDQSEAVTLSGNVYFDEDMPNCPPIIVGEGGLNLIIKDGVTVTIDCSNMSNYAGIRSTSENDALTITAGTDDGSTPPGYRKAYRKRVEK